MLIIKITSIDQENKIPNITLIEGVKKIKCMDKYLILEREWNFPSFSTLTTYKFKLENIIAFDAVEMEH